MILKINKMTADFIAIGLIVVIALVVVFRKKIFGTKEIDKPVDPKPEVPVEPTPEPEPIPEPEPKPEKPKYDKVKVILDNNSEVDNSEKLREYFKEDNTIYELPSGEFFAIGYLDSDPKNHSGIQTAKHGVLRIQDRKNVILKGDDTILYNLEPAVPYLNPETGEPYPNNGQHASQRKIFYILNSEYVKLTGVGGKSSNIIPRNPDPTSVEYRPQYSRRWEFEHLVDVRDSQFVILENMYGRGLWGDGIYINNSSDIFVKNVLVDWNGRQGGAIIAGTHLYVERYRVTSSNRSGFDIEGNLGKDDCEDVVICYSLFNTHLVGFPMGGPGLVKNFLAINNELSDTAIWSKGDGVERFRENIMFVRTRARALGTYSYTNNILIDGIEQAGLWYNEKFVGEFNNCTNITIRNCKINQYGWRGESQEPFVMVQGNTPISEYKVYDNEVPVGVINWNEEKVSFEDFDDNKYYMVTGHNLGDSSDDVEPYFLEFHKSSIVRGKAKEMPEGKYLEALEIHFPDKGISDEEKVSIPFKTNDYIEMQWDRLYTNGHGWRDEDYKDDNWKPDWYSKI